MQKALLLFSVALFACGDDDGSPDTGAPPADSGTPDTGTTDSGPVVDSGADPDTSPPTDTSVPPDAMCRPESDMTHCSRASAECGSIEATDACGTRTVDCGGCGALEACGVDVDNRCANENWVITLIDDGGDVGKEVSLVIDGSDGLHVAYRLDGGGISGDLRYAERSATGWAVEVLDADVIAGRHTAIAIDGAGTVHVAAPAGNTTPSRGIDLHTREAGGWTMQMIGTSTMGRLGLTFDGSDRAHLCAYDPPGSGFGGFLNHFAEQGDGSFSRTTIDGSTASSSRTGDHCTITFAGGTFRTSYYDGNFMRLKYAARTSGAWGAEVVDEPAGDSAGDYTSMALDTAGLPVIAYRALSVGGREIRVARPDTSSWDITTVDSAAGTIANFTSVAVDASDMAHLSYFDSGAPGTIRYAYETASGFTREDVAVVGTGTGGHSAIGIDTTGAVHIVFYDVDRSSLYHATPRP